MFGKLFSALFASYFRSFKEIAKIMVSKSLISTVQRHSTSLSANDLVLQINEGNFTTFTFL